MHHIRLSPLLLYAALAGCGGGYDVVGSLVWGSGNTRDDDPHMTVTVTKIAPLAAQGVSEAMFSQATVLATSPLAQANEQAREALAQLHSFALPVRDSGYCADQGPTLYTLTLTDASGHSRHYHSSNWACATGDLAASDGPPSGYVDVGDVQRLAHALASAP